jgi:hypothetical protein
MFIINVLNAITPVIRKSHNPVTCLGGPASETVKLEINNIITKQ